MIEKAIAYVKANKTWTAWEDAQALDYINNRMPIPNKIADEIADLMEEFGEENVLPEGWWYDYGDENDIFLEL